MPRRTITSKPPKQQSKCRYCGKIFGRPADRNRHENIHKGIKPYKCTWPDCGKSFTQNSALKTHKNVHTREKPFPCGLAGCKKWFGDLSSATRHRKELHGPIEYRCKGIDDRCKKHTKRKSEFKKHLRQDHFMHTLRHEQIEELAISMAVPLMTTSLDGYDSGCLSGSDSEGSPYSVALSMSTPEPSGFSGGSSEASDSLPDELSQLPITSFGRHSMDFNPLYEPSSLGTNMYNMPPSFVGSSPRLSGVFSGNPAVPYGYGNTYATHNGYLSAPAPHSSPYLDPRSISPSPEPMMFDASFTPPHPAATEPIYHIDSRNMAPGADWSQPNCSTLLYFPS